MPSLLLLVLPACTAGTAYLVPITRNDLPPGEPLIQTVPLSEAYYAVDADGTLSIGMRRSAESLAGASRSFEWLLSIVLEDLPAGEAKLYKVAQREVRATQSHGGDHRRWRSTFGVVVVEAPSDGRLKGRYHLTVQQQQFGVLTGWTPPIYRGQVLTLAGEFKAVENARRTREIVSQTEADGFDRYPLNALQSPTTTSGPASRP